MTDDLSDFEARLSAVRPAVPPAALLAGIQRRANRRWSRRVRWLIELAAAAVIVIALGSWLWTTLRAPYQLEGSARVVDARGEPTKLASGAWIESADTSATLRIRGHARIELSPHTRIRVQGERSPYSVTLDSGQLTCHVQPKSAAVEFVTPDGRVAGQGSDEATFSLNYSKDENPMNRKLVVSVLAGVAMLATLDGQTTLAAGEGRQVGPAVTAPASQPADRPVVVTNADNYRTVKVNVGQIVRVELANKTEGAGWSVHPDLKLESLERIKGDVASLTDKRFEACLAAGLNDFIPADAKAEPGKATVGTYVFVFRAAKPGRQVLSFHGWRPGGPFPIAVRAVTSTGLFELFVDVTGSAPPASQPALAPLAAKRLAELKQTLPNTRSVYVYFNADNTGPKEVIGFAENGVQMRVVDSELDAKAMDRLLDWLAASGVLADAHDDRLKDKVAPPAFPYVKVRVNHYSLYLPLADAMRVLNGMKAALPDKPAAALADFIKRIDAAAAQPVGRPVFITNADNGKTVRAVVGQTVVVALTGERPRTGWEVSGPKGDSLKPLKVGGRIGDQDTPDAEFTPAKDAADAAIGEYRFRYVAVAEGQTVLLFHYVSPGGPGVNERLKTSLVAEMTVTVDVGKAAATSQPALAPLAAKRLAELKKHPGAAADVGVFLHADMTGKRNDEFHLVGPLCETRYGKSSRCALTQGEFNRLLDWLAASVVLANADDDRSDSPPRQSPALPNVEVRVGPYHFYRSLSDGMVLLGGMKVALPANAADEFNAFSERIAKQGLIDGSKTDKKDLGE